MEFIYVDSEGEHKDVLPVDLKEGKAFGGWAAFTASSAPKFTITRLESRGIFGDKRIEISSGSK
jgi:hypothetical protein